MKLFYSAASPFVRKVMVCAILRGLDGQIETVTTNPQAAPPDLLAANPLSKVPCLIGADGVAYFDSPVICEYLDTLGSAPPLFPTAAPARLRALLGQAMGDGILDAAVARRGEQARPREDARDAAMARMAGAVVRTLAALEANPPGEAMDIGAITIACALGYLDFRFAAEPWRAAHPRLAAWFARVSDQPAFVRTVPKG